MFTCYWVIYRPRPDPTNSSDDLTHYLSQFPYSCPIWIEDGYTSFGDILELVAEEHGGYRQIVVVSATLMSFQQEEPYGYRKWKKNREARLAKRSTEQG